MCKGIVYIFYIYTMDMIQHLFVKTHIFSGPNFKYEILVKYKFLL